MDGKNRWGDYSGISMEPNNSHRIWIYSAWANTSEWSTWVGEINSAETTAFYFTNKYLNTNLGGSLTVDNNPVISGGSTPLEAGAVHNANTNIKGSENGNISVDEIYLKTQQQTINFIIILLAVTASLKMKHLMI